MAEPTDFKVIDRRKEKEKEIGDSKEGDGFVMKEGHEPGPHELDFSTFVLSLATGALIHLGLAPDPATKKVTKNIDLARQNIDLLAILREKTKGNLTSDESQLMESLLTEVRLRFVQATKK